MRIRISNQRLPGWTSTCDNGECEVYDPDGNHVGRIVYVRMRRRDGGSDYGWIVFGEPYRRLSGKVEAVLRLAASRVAS